MYSHIYIVKSDFEEALKAYAKKELNKTQKREKEEIDHIVLWLGDIVIVYIDKLNSGKEDISIEVNFPALNNLECLSHKIGSGYSSIPPFKQDALMIF